MKAGDNIRFYSSPLNRIRQSGILRVGTTGDYLPFSYSDDGTDFRGIDIDLAHDLGDSLGVEVLFVSTSWPTLTRDLSDNRYDIAMSGVSIIDSRKRFGHFSQPYHTGGKTPITRCEHLSRFDSLEKIDRPGVRLIVNPGGTNERFIDEQVNQAEKVLHPDNRTIFVALVDGKADLMITDSIEATLQANLHPALCRSMPSQTVTFQEKGYLMAKDDGLKTFVDDWLADSLETGELATIFATHLNR
jgi:cyclohexadienyl dehydratase